MADTLRAPAAHLPPRPKAEAMTDPRGLRLGGDAVEFTAPCPACRRDSRWLEMRLDTRSVVRVRCSCPDAPR